VVGWFGGWFWREGSGGEKTKEIPAVEISLRLVVLKGREIRRIGITLRFPVAVTRPRRVARGVAHRSRISDSSHIKDRDRPGKIRLRHMTKSACLISVDRELLVKKHELPERLHPLHPAPNVVWD